MVCLEGEGGGLCGGEGGGGGEGAGVVVVGTEGGGEGSEGGWWCEVVGAEAEAEAEVGEEAVGEVGERWDWFGGHGWGCVFEGR